MKLETWYALLINGSYTWELKQLSHKIWSSNWLKIDINLCTSCTETNYYQKYSTSAQRVTTIHLLYKYATSNFSQLIPEEKKSHINIIVSLVTFISLFH